MAFDKRNISIFQRNVNVNEGIFFWKKVIVDSVKYSQSLLQQERLKRLNDAKNSGGTDQPEEEVSLDTMSYFSDDGSKIAFYNKISNGSKSINVYSVDLIQKRKTYLHNIDVTNTLFDARLSESCFVSNDGQYIILSVPSASTVYFLDAKNGVLLQTITDEQVNFGSLIAVDSDFKGLVISTNNLRKQPSEYDVRVTCNESSSLIHYYKRNYKSKLQQKFKKIHSKTAFSPFTDNSSFCFPLSFIYGIQYPLENTEPNAYQFNGVYRCSDIYSKNGNFSYCSLALKSDQISYKSRLFNYNSPRYSIKNLITTNIRQSEYLKISKNFSPGSGMLQHIRIDSFYDTSTYKMVNFPSCNIFKIIKTEDKETIDNSIYSSVPIGTNINITDTISNTVLLATNQQYSDNFNKKHTVYDFLNIYDVASVGYDFSAFESLLNTEHLMIENKVCLNSTYVFNICVFMTNNIKNIRINRYPINSSDNLNTFSYIDHSYNGSNYSNYPNDPSIGLIKILYPIGQYNNLENCFLSNQQTADLFSSSIVGQNFADERILYSKPFLQNPTQCSDSEFALSVDSSVLSQTLKNCYCSDDYLFLNFNADTLIFKIHSDVCKSVKFTNKVPTLKDYDFCYMNNAEYFCMDKKIYKFNRTSGIVEESMVL